LSGTEMMVFHYVKLIFDSGPSMLENFSIPCVLQMHQTVRRMEKEIHRMHAYVRFQKGADGVFYSFIAPDFNVLPLIADHFEKRFADQDWLIFDTRRKYGIYYDRKQVNEVQLEEARVNDTTGNVWGEVLDVKEGLYQQLWKAYFHSVNIPERKNLKLQLRSMPRRYWRYLTEMKGGSQAPAE
jgi:probable DNA metabolism protein